MSEIYRLRALSAGPETRRTGGDSQEQGSGVEMAGSGSRAGLVDLASMPAGRPMMAGGTAHAGETAGTEGEASAYYRDDLDAESVRRLALLVKQQLSLQSLAIANAHALGILGMVRDISLM